MTHTRRYWLLKTEPESYSIDDLAAAPHSTTCWDGVRNYQARNFIRDDMKVGDGVLFYHSNANPAAIVGVASVVRESYPDSTAWDESDHHFDPKASPANPIWQMVDIRFEEKFPRPLPLDELRGVAGLAGMELLRTGSRLSVQPVNAKQWEIVLQLAYQPGPTAVVAVTPPKKKSPRATSPRKKAVPKKKSLSRKKSVKKK